MDDEEGVIAVINTVVVIEEGIGAVSLGFAAAGFQVTDVFIKDKKSVDIYKKNIETRIYESGLMELSPKEITDVHEKAHNIAMRKAKAHF